MLPYLHHAVVCNSQFSHHSSSTTGLLGSERQGLGHLPPRGEGGRGGSIAATGGRVYDRTQEKIAFESRNHQNSMRIYFHSSFIV